MTQYNAEFESRSTKVGKRATTYEWGAEQKAGAERKLVEANFAAKCFKVKVVKT